MVGDARDIPAGGRGMELMDAPEAEDYPFEVSLIVKGKAKDLSAGREKANVLLGHIENLIEHDENLTLDMANVALGNTPADGDG